MKLFKLTISGSVEEFTINYTSSSDFMNYNNCEYTGNEEEKYSAFLSDLEKNGGAQPINIKVKMKTKSTDRAFSKNEILNLKSSTEFINKL